MLEHSQRKEFTSLESSAQERMGAKGPRSLTGFTVLELIITVFIITVGITAISGLTQQTLSYAYFNSSKFIASYLTQEGFEIVKNIVDANLIEGDAWDEGLQASCVTVGGCIVDYNHSYDPTHQEDPSLPSYAGQYLNIDSNNFYSYSAGTQTKFQRKITITQQPDNSLAVKVEVFWQDKGKSSTVSVQENLYNWRQ